MIKSQLVGRRSHPVKPVGPASTVSVCSTSKENHFVQLLRYECSNLLCRKSFLFSTSLEEFEDYTAKGPFINYVTVPMEGVGKISTYSYFGEGVKPILT